jgi:GABA permease
MRRRIEARGEELRLKMWLFPGLSYMVIGGIVAVLVLMAATPGQFIQVALSAVSVAFILAAFLLRKSFGVRMAVGSV